MLLETLSLRPWCILDLFFVSMRTCCHKSIVVPFSFLNTKKKSKQNLIRKCSRSNKLTSVFHASVLLLIINFITILSVYVRVAMGPRGNSRVDPQTTFTMLSLSTHVLLHENVSCMNLTSICFYNYNKLSIEIVCSRSLHQH